ncbi:MAG TPA: cytochrome P450 [Steroidobacteraceae bacterium]|nr:cytochrome P450 [Steroidobacteraceae bacterium]
MDTNARTVPAMEWDPQSGQAIHDPVANYDAMRRRCPVAHSQLLHWSLFRHADVVRALDQPEIFSNEVSTHLSVPNGMDPPVHTGYRRIIDPYFSAQRMRALEPACRRIAAGLLDAVPADAAVEVMETLAEPFALRAQAAFLDWPAELHAPLREWVCANHAATRSRDPAATAAVALAFDRHIRAVLEARRRGAVTGDDVASRLMRERIEGRELTEAEIVSILRNWTVGELATIAASVGILVHFFAQRPEVVRRLRADTGLLPAAIDEILRIDPPLIASRRKTKCPVTVAGQSLGAGERVTLLWASANRDERTCGDPDEFRTDRDPELNLLYGRGLHVCPGAPLARLELRVFVEEFLARGFEPQVVAAPAPVRAIYPGSGFATLHVRFGAPSSS